MSPGILIKTRSDVAKMETSIHAFFFHGDGTIGPVSPTVIHDLRAGRVELSEHAGERLRYAIVRVDAREREALQLTPMWCGILHFDEQGRQDRTMIEQQHDLTTEALLSSFRKTRDGPTSRVVDARGHFAQQQLNHKYSWTPTEKELEEVRQLMADRRSPRGRLELLP